MHPTVAVRPAALPLAAVRRHIASTLTGLTPTLVAIVLLIVLARAAGFALSLWPAYAASPRALLVYFVSALLPLGLTAAMALVCVTAAGNLGPARGMGRTGVLAAAVVLSTGIGAALAPTLLDTWAAAAFRAGWLEGAAPGQVVWWDYVRIVWARNVVIVGLLTVGLETVRRRQASAAALREAALDRESLGRDLDEARGQLLRAQIEPHFLFNTLAHVQHLMAADSVAGRAMLDSLTRYLEVALPRLRESRTTLGEDLELVDAYLRIQQIRMGRRLSYAIELPPGLAGAVVPSMLLLTLVENAIKHGLQPRRAGGSVRVSARVDHGGLLVEVVDDGAGLTSGSGTGAGLAHVRARLAAQFGASAALTLVTGEHGGVRAAIRLPLQGAIA